MAMQSTSGEPSSNASGQSSECAGELSSYASGQSSACAGEPSSVYSNAPSSVYSDAPRSVYSDAPRSVYSDAPRSVYSDAPRSVCAGETSSVQPSSVCTIDLKSVSGLNKTIPTVNWMSSLPTTLHNLPITNLTLPGTHNSGTFSIRENLSPDACEGFRKASRIPLIGSRVIKTISYWAKCQNLNFTEQFNAGIRYFDLRVSPGAGSEDFSLVHSVFGAKLSDLLDALLILLEAHPHEVVLLDFNHFHGMDERNHNQLIQHLISKFGSRLCSPCPITDLTLQNMWNHEKQVIIFYHNLAASVEEMWPGHRISSPWACTDNPLKCKEFLRKCFTVHRADFTVCQGVLTPNYKTVIRGLSLRHSGFVRGLSRSLLPHLCHLVSESRRKFAYPPNIIIADFVEDGDLIQIILKLNYKAAVSAER